MVITNSSEGIMTEETVRDRLPELMIEDKLPLVKNLTEAEYMDYEESEAQPASLSNRISLSPTALIIMTVAVCIFLIALTNLITCYFLKRSRGQRFSSPAPEVRRIGSY